MAEVKDIKVPDIGDFKSVEVIEVLVKVGDSVKAEDSLITVESDKASMEIPSPEAGVIKDINVKVGDSISQGSVILSLEAAGAAPANKDKSQEKPAAAPAAAEQKPVETKREQRKTEAVPETAGNGKEIEVTIPDIGDFKNIPVIEILVSPGDTIKAEDPLIALESDKATMEIPSPQAGTVKEILLKVGDKVSKGTPMAVLAAKADAQPATAAKPAPATESKPESKAESKPAATASQYPAQATGQRPAPMPPVSESGFSKAHASPSVRKFARELGADLSRIAGSGPKGRVLKNDVQSYIKQVLTSGTATAGGGSGLQVAELPEIDFSAFGEIESQPLSKINKLTGKFLHRSWVYIPHVTQFDEADITELEAFRKQLSEEYKKDGVKITMIAFLLKACATALREFPRFNASLDNSGENLILKKYCHIGVAVDTPDGLIVPVIRDVDKKGIVDLARDVIDVAARGREKKIKPSEMQGACFTISSLGGIGGTAFTPIVNLPEVAILGVSRSSMKPVYDGKQFVPRLMLPLSLSYDHRVIDGVAAAKFTTYLSQLLGDVRRLLL